MFNIMPNIRKCTKTNGLNILYIYLRPLISRIHNRDTCLDIGKFEEKPHTYSMFRSLSVK